MRLPASRGLAHAITDAPAAPIAAARLRVLVIDDDPAVARALELVLAPHHDVAVETRAQDALARIARGGELDVILCDLMMPEMNGMDFHAALVERAPASTERIVFLTGGAFTPAARDFLERVPNRRLEKPFDVDALFAVIEEVAGVRAAQSEAAAPPRSA